MVSRIPNPDFVACGDCRYRRVKKIFVMNRGIRRVPFCVREHIHRQLRGQKGCDEGVKKKGIEQ